MIYIIRYGSGSKQNERKTLRKSISLGSLVEKLSNMSLKIAVSKYTYHPPVYLWDFGVRASEHISNEDLIYIQCDETLYYAKVLEKIEDLDGEIGDLVGWRRIRQQSWKNPVVLSSAIRLIGIPPILGIVKDYTTLRKNFYKLNCEL